MRTVWVTGGSLLLGLGSVWIFQGIGVIKGSFMTGQPFWAWMGAIADMIGLASLAHGLRKRDR